MRKKCISQEAIIDSAINIIKDKGLEACSMRCISKDLGVAVGTIYNYYESHDLLLKDVLEVSWKKTFDRLDYEIDLRHNHKEQLGKYCKIMFEEIRNRRGLGKSLYGQLPMNLQEGDVIIEPFAKQLRLIGDIIKDAPKNKHLDDRSLEMVSMWIILSILSFVSSERYDENIFIEEMITRFV